MFTRYELLNLISSYSRARHLLETLNFMFNFFLKEKLVYKNTMQRLKKFSKNLGSTWIYNSCDASPQNYIT